MAYDRTLLTADALQSFLAEHPGWKHEGGMLRRTYEAPSFLEGIAFVSRWPGPRRPPTTTRTSTSAGAR